MTKFRCSTCHEEHDLAEISFGADAPTQWQLVSEDERSRSELNSDQCILESQEGRHYFVRACLEIPIQGSDRHFTWGVWVSLSEKSFIEMTEHWNDPNRVGLGPYFAWLCTRIPEYPDSLHLRSMVHQRAVGLRPTVELEQTDHPLALDQKFGINKAKLEEIVRRVLHEPAGDAR